MYKIATILIVSLFFLGCSAGKRSKSGNLTNEYTGSLQTAQLIRSNITETDFFISKATVEVKSGVVGMVLTVTIKYKSPDEYLISIRTGSIEAGRVYISADTLLVNNRLNRTVYYGEPEYIFRKYGFSPEVLPLLFGDFIQGNNYEANILCSDQNTQFSTSIKGLRIRYFLDCGIGKIKKTIQEGSLNSTGTEVSYNDFFKSTDKLIPGSIMITNSERGIRITMKIEKVERPWTGEIEFLPGNNYELKELK